jgi:hypothetical protein
MAQENLIPNGDFEYYIECPTFQNGWYEINKAAPWYNPTLNTPDYFNVCDTLVNQLGVPKNLWGFQYANSGDAYAGFAVHYGSINGREYISTSLTATLTNGKQYQMNFFLNLSNQSAAASSSIGAYFSIDSIQGDTTIQVINLKPQIKLNVDNVITDTLNWVRVTDTFIADGGERFLTIGNFNDDEHTVLDTFHYVPNYWHLVYYYIDDVSLYEVTEDTTPKHPILHNPIAVTNLKPPPEALIIPTLISGKDLYWQFIHLQPNTAVKLYNALGQLVFSSFNYQNNLSVGFLAAGVYFYEVEEENGERVNGKVVVMR